MAKEQHDFFAELALKDHPADKENLREIPPVSYQKKWLPFSKRVAPEVREVPFEEKLEQFHRQLAALREKYRPFLRNLTPPMELKRKQTELKTFAFRYHTDEDTDFEHVHRGGGEWEQVTTPDFRGPTKFDGRWTGYYRTEFAYERPQAADKRVFLVFKGVDYKASVYLNRKCVGSHEGFFAPFEFDVTDYLRERNTLVVEVQNDYPMMGVAGTNLSGDKIYAATGPGWDDPEYGWHHCPPGAGIYNRVYLEERSILHVHDLFVRPNIDEQAAELWIDVTNTTDKLVENVYLQVEIMPKNFEGDSYGMIEFPVEYAGPGLNYYRYKVKLPQCRLWELDEPYLYMLRVKVLDAERKLVDMAERHFGMRSFRMDEDSEPKGSLYFNNRPIILRGANEMGHLQQCVMKGDWDQLVDDILIAKLANMNFYRITQRPVQEEIYDYMDMLGMMQQTDLPLFGFLRRNQFCEAVRQAAEMERLIRSHPSSVIVSLINEPSRTVKRTKKGEKNRGHRYCHRDELEAFFVAARQAIYIENPDRIVKNTDGDYDPPTREGLQDFHCYNMWYTNNIIPFGKMYKGYLPPLRAGWKTGNGEYGAEGLDHLEVMKRYPKEWLPEHPDDRWMPDKIVDNQTYSLGGDWFPEQETIRDWIRESQKYQAFATKMMTDAWRRRADLIVSTAIHLLIDAWPAGWMKTLVGCDRIPKPAYFTYQACLEPLRVNLRGDRWRAYAGETVEVETWLLNDTAADRKNLRIIATVRDDQQVYASFETEGEVAAVSSAYAGTVQFIVPDVKGRKALYVDACLQDEEGRVLNQERFVLEAFERQAPVGNRAVQALGDRADLICSLIGVPVVPFSVDGDEEGAIAVSTAELFHQHKETILNQVQRGATAVLFGSAAEGSAWELPDGTVKAVKLREVYTLAADTSDPRLAWMKPNDIAFLYNRLTDQIDGITHSQVVGDGIEPIVFTYQQHKQPGGKTKLPVVARKPCGSGEFIFVVLPLEGRIGCNPPLDWLLASYLAGSN